MNRGLGTYRSSREGNANRSRLLGVGLDSLLREGCDELSWADLVATEDGVFSAAVKHTATRPARLFEVSRAKRAAPDPCFWVVLCFWGLYLGRLSPFSRLSLSRAFSCPTLGRRAVRDGPGRHLSAGRLARLRRPRHLRPGLGRFGRLGPLRRLNNTYTIENSRHVGFLRVGRAGCTRLSSVRNGESCSGEPAVETSTSDVRNVSYRTRIEDWKRIP